MKFKVTHADGVDYIREIFGMVNLPLQERADKAHKIAFDLIDPMIQCETEPFRLLMMWVTGFLTAFYLFA